MHAFKRVAAGVLTVAVLAAGGALVAPAARAQINPFTTRPVAGLEKDDIDRLGRAAERLYSGRSIGTVERWRSPDTGNSGSVKLLRVFTGKGMPCRTLRYRVRLHDRQGRDPDQFVVNWCRTASGEWKLLDPAP